MISRKPYREAIALFLHRPQVHDPEAFIQKILIELFFVTNYFQREKFLVGVMMSAIAGDLDKLRAFEPLLTQAVVSAAQKVNHPKLVNVEKVAIAKLSKDGALCILKARGSDYVHYRRISQTSLEKLRELQGGSQEMIQAELGALAARWVKLRLVFNMETEKNPVKVGDIARVTMSIHREHLDASKSVMTSGPILGFVILERRKFIEQELIETGMKCRAIYDQGKKEYVIPEEAFPKIGINPSLLQKATRAYQNFLRSLVGLGYSYYDVEEIILPEESGEKTIKFYLGKKWTVAEQDDHKA